MTVNNSSTDFPNDQIGNFVNAMRAAKAQVELEIDDGRILSIRINDVEIDADDLSYFSHNYGLRTEAVVAAPVVEPVLTEAFETVITE